MKKKHQRAKVVGCIPFDQEGLGFAIPVFIDPSGPKRFVVQEIDEINGRVGRFRILENDRPQLIHVKRASVGIGEEQLYAFFTNPTDVSVGTLEALRTMLNQFAEANPSRTALNLQIKELVGSNAEKKAARARMRERLLEGQGTAVARSFYEGAVLRSVLWNCLLSAATSKEMAGRILEARGRLAASIDQGGQIVLNIAALNEKDQAVINTAKLVSAMLLEFEPQPGQDEKTASSEENQVHDATKVQRKVDDLLDAIQRTGRQEERIALLMAAILHDPAVGKSALLQCRSDRARTASWAIAELRKAFVDATWSSDTHVIAGLIPQLFTKNWPMTRGDLLFFLAKHLGQFPRVSAAIRDVLQKTHSMYVDLSRKEIEEALSTSPTMSRTSQGVARGAHDIVRDA